MGPENGREWAEEDQMVGGDARWVVGLKKWAAEGEKRAVEVEEGWWIGG